MSQFANIPAVRKILMALLITNDWPFSFQLLTLLQPYMNGKDLKTLLQLLQMYEEPQELTIQERLSQGDDIASFNDALCEFLDLHPETSNKTLTSFIANLVDGNLPTRTELDRLFQKQPTELKKLILGAGKFSSCLPEPGLPLLHFLKILAEIDLKGCNCLVAIINRTRKYSGFFRQRISLAISNIIENDPNLQNTQALPDLQAIIEFIRQRPHYDQLRQKILLHISQTTRNAKDLRLFLNATLNRDLRVFTVKRKPPQPHPHN